MADGDDATTLEGRNRPDPTVLEGRGGPDSTTMEGRDGATATTLDDAQPVSAPFFRRNLPPPLADRYDVIRTLSDSSSQADVYLARTKSDGTEVAIKLYRSLSVAMDAAEEALVERCDSAHVVPTSFDQWQDEKWEVQEYMVRGTLADLPKNLGHNPTTEELYEVARELIEALDHIHSHNLAHRDIKPSNILIRTTVPLDLVLADFGLARTLDAGSQLGSMSRTERYAAPEVLRGVHTFDSDWWSLGITLAEVALGRHPFASNSGRELTDAQVMAFLIDSEVDLSGVRDDRLRLLLAGLLTKDRAHRWGSEQTAAWLRGESPTVYQPTPGNSVRDWRFAGFLGRTYTSTSELGQTLAENWSDALRYLQNDATKLRNALAKTPLADDVENVFTRRRQNLIKPEGQLFELITIMDPGAEPSFRGKPLSPGGLSATAAAAVNGDTESGQWIHGLRTEEILQLTHNFENYPQFAAIDEKLSTWWRAIDTAKSDAVRRQSDYRSTNSSHLNGDEGRSLANISVVLDAAAPIIEGTLLACALGDEQINRTHNAVPAITSAHAPWLSQLAQEAKASDPISPARDLVVSVLASSAADDKKVVDAARAATLQQRRAQLAKSGFVAKLWLALPYLIVVGFGFILTVADVPGTSFDTFVPMLKAIGIGTAIAVLVCYLSDRFIGRSVRWALAIAVSLGFTIGWSAVSGSGGAFAGPIIGATVGYVAAATATRLVPAISDEATFEKDAPRGLASRMSLITWAGLLGVPLALVQMVMSMSATSGSKVASWVTDMTLTAWPWLASILGWFGGLSSVTPEGGALWAIPCMIILLVMLLWNGIDRASGSSRHSVADAVVIVVAVVGLLIAIMTQWTIAVLVTGLLLVTVAVMAAGVWIATLFA